MRSITPYITPMNHRYNAKVDKFVNDLLDLQPEIAKSTTDALVTFKVKNKYISIWIENKWYAYAGCAYDSTDSRGILSVFGTKLWEKSRPSRKTLVRLDDYVKEHRVIPEFDLSISKVLK